MKITRSREKGQILVIFALVLIVLLGFIALAIDGGMIFADRRYEQSAADSASMTGAGTASQYMEDHSLIWTDFSCTNPIVTTAKGLAYTAAVNQAATNNVTGLNNDVSNNHHVFVDCVDQPQLFERYLEVQTVVSSTVSTSFMQLFYNGPAKNTVTGHVRIHPRTPLAFGNAIVSLSDQCGTNQGGIVFDGTSNVVIHGGGVFSNSCLDASGNVDVSVVNNNGGIQYTTPGGLTINGGASLSPGATFAPKKLVMDVTPPDCPFPGPAVLSQGGGTISPGNYSKIKLTGSSVLNMNPGLYCLSGDMDIQGGTVNASTGVTIYVMGPSNNVQINGGAEVHFNAPTDATQTPNPNGSLVNILFYMAHGNTGDIALVGNSASSFVGIVFGPDASINVGGTTGVNPTYSTQLIGHYVKVHGTSNIDINYTASPKNTSSPVLDMTQ